MCIVVRPQEKLAHELWAERLRRSALELLCRQFRSRPGLDDTAGFVAFVLFCSQPACTGQAGTEGNEVNQEYSHSLASTHHSFFCPLIFLVLCVSELHDPDRVLALLSAKSLRRAQI
jgi:hypothetical protein